MARGPAHRYTDVATTTEGQREQAVCKYCKVLRVGYGRHARWIDPSGESYRRAPYCTRRGVVHERSTLPPPIAALVGSLRQLARPKR